MSRPTQLESLSALAGRIGLKPSRLREMCARREIPHYRIHNRLFFAEAEIALWLQRQRVEVAVAGEQLPASRGRDHVAECEALGLEPNHRFM